MEIYIDPVMPGWRFRHEKSFTIPFSTISNVKIKIFNDTAKRYQDCSI